MKLSLQGPLPDDGNKAKIMCNGRRQHQTIHINSTIGEDFIDVELTIDWNYTRKLD